MSSSSSFFIHDMNTVDAAFDWFLYIGNTFTYMFTHVYTSAYKDNYYH